MRNLALGLTCGVALFAAGCGTSPATNNSNTGNAATTANQTSRASNTGLPPVSSAHGDNPIGTPPATTSAPASGAAKPGIDTAALDAKIERAEAKAKAAGATEADKNAAAAAYVERGNVYYSAGQPALYKFALGDFRRALRYQPNNEEAKAKRDQIVDIYENSLQRPVPTNGLEP